jgi:predicted nucleic acid-binding protein
VIVVSDTSPLNYLILIDSVEVLPNLFREVHVPAKIVEELQRSRAPSTVRAWAASPPPWLRVTDPTTMLDESIRLDPGEAQAIALANELGADLILIDERKGRRVAKELGLKTVGTLTVLEMAAELRLLELGAAIDALRRTTFHIADEHINAALARDAARKRP